MEDKSFELLTQIYSELKEFRENTNEQFKGINNRLVKIETTLENNIKPDIKASLEGYQKVYEKLKHHEKQLESIDSKLEKQDVEIRVIKGAK